MPILKLIISSVSTLLTLAGRETAPKKSDFVVILIEQVKHLREELESGSEMTIAKSCSRGSEAGAETQRAMAQSEQMSGGGQVCFPYEGLGYTSRTQHLMRPI